MDVSVVLTPLHWAYLAGVAVILSAMCLKKDTPAFCLILLFLLGLVGLHSPTGALMSVFRAVVYASKEFMEIIATIALVTALSKTLRELGSDRVMMLPFARAMKHPARTWWILGAVMFLFSLFLWPSPSVALVGAIMLPFAVKSGLSPLYAAMAMNLFGHGFALSFDCIIQGAPAISAASAGIETSQVLQSGLPLFLVMSIVTVCSAFFLNRKAMQKTVASASDPEAFSTLTISPCGKMLAVLTPLAFLLDIVVMIRLGLRGSDATSLVSGTAVFLMVLGSLLAFGVHFPERVTEYVSGGFLFAIRIFAPVILIGAYFFLGGSGASEILGISSSNGILNDWALWLAGNASLNKYMAAFLELAVGAVTGLDGSGFSGLPLTGSLAGTFGRAVGGSVPVLAALGQIGAVFVGGGTIIPWGLVPVAAICDVSPFELARRNLLPVCLGFAATFLVACVLI